MDQRYHYALASALAILDAIDARPDEPKHIRLALVVGFILQGMERHEADRFRMRERVSIN